MSAFIKTFFTAMVLLPIMAFSQAPFALEYDGDDTYCRVDFDGEYNCENVTIEVWIKPDRVLGGDSYDVVLNKPYEEHEAPYHQWLIIRRSLGDVLFQLSIEGELRTVACDHNMVGIGNWCHLAGTYDGEFIRLFVNGELRGIVESRGSITGYNSDLWIGKFGNRDYDRYNGVIDELRIWNLARDQEQIRQTMNIPLAGNEEGLIGYFRFDEGEGQVINDSSPVENHGWLGWDRHGNNEDPIWIESDVPIYAGEVEISLDFLEFGAVSVDQAVEIEMSIVNVAEIEDDWHVVDFSITDQGDAPFWLTFDPDEGSIPPGEEIVVTFTANTEELEFGEYERTVLIELNAMNIQFVELPVHFFVVEGFGQLFGTVTNADDNSPLEGAPVVVDYFGFVDTTDEDGEYAFPDIPAWTYDLVVDLPDYLTYRDREVVGAGENVRRDIALLHATLAPAPARIEVLMQPNDEFEAPLVIHNGGNGPLSWSVEKVFPEGGEIDPWVFRGGFNAGDSVGDNRMVGIEFVNGRFYLTGGANRVDQSLIYIFDQEGNYLDQFPQFAETRYGIRDLAYDGRLLWGIDGNTIYGFTTDGNLVRELDSPVNAMRYITYDPERKALWVSSITTSIVGITLDGEEIGELSPPPDTHIYGLGWFPEDAEGYFLYVFTNDGDYHQQVHKINPATNESIFVRDLMDVEDARAGGVAISGTWDPYSWVFMSMLDSPDMVGIWQLAPRTNWLVVAPIAGVVEPDGEVVLTVTLNSLWLPINEEFEADLRFTHDGIGGETTVPVSLLITDVGGVSQRIIRLDLGWNIVSSNAVPPEDSVEVIMRPLVEENLLLIMKDGDGHFYMPAFHYNDIPGWNVDEGYQVKVAEDCQVVIEGEVVAWDTPIELQDGWQIVSYYPRDPVDAMVALAGIEEQLLIAKDGWGHFYIPAFGFSDIGDMREGQGYQVKLQGNGQLIYRLGEDAAARYIESPNKPVHFGAVAPTGNNMSLLVMADVSYAGDELAVFNKDGRLAGSGVFDAAGRCGLAVWGDDPATDEVDGMLPGEALELRRYDNSTGTKEQVEIKDILVGTGVTYSTDAYTVMTVSDVPTVPQDFYLSSAYPNPFNNQTRFSFGLPVECEVSIAVYDVSGRLVTRIVDGDKPAGHYSVSWNADQAAVGVYLVRLETSSYSAVRKMILVK